MKKSKYSDAQIMVILKQAENGVPSLIYAASMSEQREFLQVAVQVRWYGCQPYGADVVHHR